jgi:hypothetical protein
MEARDRNEEGTERFEQGHMLALNTGQGCREQGLINMRPRIVGRFHAG